MSALTEDLIIVCKRDCATCTMLLPVFAEIDASDTPLVIYTQDDPSFPANVSSVAHDASLERSYDLKIEVVPTIIHMKNGQEKARHFGWNKAEWRAITGIETLGEGLPDSRPGCGARNVEPGIAEELEARYGDTLKSRHIDVAPLTDDMELGYDMGWSDGLPVVPPTPARVLRMLKGTTRTPDEIVGVIAPNNAECSVEKVAINAVMAGCKPEYLPVVIAAVEAACMDDFCMHGVLATTYFSGPVVIVNGPITKKIGMNSGGNALGQGNRANATIGRALQLVIRNVGGGKPGGVDRSTLGNPGKYTFCFAEREEDSPWESLAVERGFPPDASTVTIFAGDGVQAIADQQSRAPESLAKTLAACLRVVAHPKLAMAADAFLVVTPEHARTFAQAGWSKAKLKEELGRLLTLEGKEMVRGAGGITEGIPEKFEGEAVPKFRRGGLNIVHVGGTAGLFSAVIGGWLASGPKGSIPVTREIKP
jgi:hypothetical protein